MSAYGWYRGSAWAWRCQQALVGFVVCVQVSPPFTQIDSKLSLRSTDRRPQRRLHRTLGPNRQAVNLALHDWTSVEHSLLLIRPGSLAKKIRPMNATGPG